MQFQNGKTEGLIPNFDSINFEYAIGCDDLSMLFNFIDKKRKKLFIDACTKSICKNLLDSLNLNYDSLSSKNEQLVNTFSNLIFKRENYLRIRHLNITPSIDSLTANYLMEVIEKPFFPDLYIQFAPLFFHAAGSFDIKYLPKIETTFLKLVNEGKIHPFFAATFLDYCYQVFYGKQKYGSVYFSNGHIPEILEIEKLDLFRNQILLPPMQTQIILESLETPNGYDFSNN